MTEQEAEVRRAAQWLPTFAGLVGAAVFLGAGVWAMSAPESFFELAARFEPYNQHFIQDLGAFQIGLGAVLLLAVLARGADTLAVALIGVGIGSAAHTASHVVGYDLGGQPATAIPLFLILTLLLLAGGVLRWRDTRGVADDTDQA